MSGSPRQTPRHRDSCGRAGRLARTGKRGWALHVSDTSFFIPSTVALPFPPLLPPYPDANRRRRRRHTATDFADFFGEIGYPLAAGGSSAAPSTTGAPSSPATSRSLVAPSLHARCSTVRLNDVRFLSFGSSAISFSCLVCLTRRHGRPRDDRRYDGGGRRVRRR